MPRTAPAAGRDASGASPLPRRPARSALAALLALVVCWAVSWPALGQPASGDLLEAKYREAEAAFRDRRLGAAASGYRELIQLSPATAELHAKLGLIEYLRGRFREAAPAFRAALERKPGLPNVATLLAISLAELGQFAEALPGLEKAFEAPEDQDLRRLIGLELQRTYLGLGRNSDASRITARLSELYPEDPEILYHVGRFHADMAIAAMRRLLDSAPDSVWGHQAAAEAFESQGNHELAVTEYRKVLAAQPGRPGVHYRIARAMQLSGGSVGSEEEALAQFRQELRIDPSNALAAYELGEIHRKRAQLGAAREYFEQAVEQRPGFGLGRIALGRVLRELEEPEAALPHLEAATKLVPENEVARYQLALVYRSLGDLVGAQQEMAAFQRLQDRDAAGRDSAKVPLQGPESTLQRLESPGR